MTTDAAPTIPAGLAFPEVMTLSAIQAHMDTVCKHFGWLHSRDEQTFVLFVEEVGELAKAIRKVTGLLEEQNNPDKPVLDLAARQQNLADEFSDVFSYLLELANRFGIDLEAAYRHKMGQAMQRQWAV